MSVEDVIARHRRSGRTFEAARVRSFVLEAGEGEPVVCMHGVPSSSFLYRKLVPDLARRGLRGVAFDLPGLGLADRHERFDYSWSGLGRWSAAAVDALSIDSFHLVVHDVGGPVGFELAAAMPERVRSLTVLNTLVAVEGFRRPWSMEPFAHRGLGEAWLASLTGPSFVPLMWLQGIGDRRAVPAEELMAYARLLKRGDRGRAFLRIMRGFERTAEKQRLYEGVVGDTRYPRQVIWGEDDPALRVDVHGEIARRAAGVEHIHRLPGKHFIQEDQAPAIGALVAELAA